MERIFGFIVNDRNAAGTANNQYIRFVTHEGGVPSPEYMKGLRQMAMLGSELQRHVRLPFVRKVTSE